MYNNKINLENGWNNVITVSNTNIKRSEKLAESYANSAKKDMQECANYLALIQRILKECENARDSINISLGQDLLNHLEDNENPHNVTPEQVGVYSKSEINEIITVLNLDDKLSVIISGENVPDIDTDEVETELEEIIGG